MLFNSIIFLLVFLPIVLLGWYQLKNPKHKLALLTISSFLFYGYWDWRFVGLMLLSILIDYSCGLKISENLQGNKQKAKQWMILSVVSNLTILGFFKYFNFFVDSFYVVFPIEQIISQPTLEVILPVGISFYTFQSMSYSIDLYRGDAQPVKSLFHFSAYVSMFPQLIAGPIVRYSAIDKQLREVGKPISRDMIVNGVFIFVLGLFRKLFIADYFATQADIFFNTGVEQQFFVSWVGVLSYTFQIYFDFSAYSEMAVGLGMMLGFNLPQNFNSPYKAKSFSDFWRRWHITLSEFLRDYLYIPLGGNRKGPVRTYINLAITMLLGGLWHGASWLFVIWGALHGFYLVIERLFRNLKPEKHGFYRVVVFVFVCLAWIFFRADNIEFAWHTFKSCLMINGFESFQASYTSFGFGVPEFIRMGGGLKYLLTLLGGLTLVNFFPNTHQLKFPKTWWAAILLAIVLFICLINVHKPSPFLYFQF